MKTNQKAVSRREFLKTSGSVALLVGVSGLLPQLISCKREATAIPPAETHQLTAWVKLSEDGTITIYNPAAEMGQGSMTSLPLIFAEEMDADWAMVRVEFSPQEAEIYGSQGWRPDAKIMLSAGSRVTKGYYPIMRKAGAQARYILMFNAAKYWRVPISDLTTESGVIRTKSGDREIKYGELVPRLEMPAELPDFSEDQLKDPKEYRFIGKKIARTDIPEKVNGAAKFAMDVRLPGMLYGVLERGNHHGATPNLKNETEILALDGIVKLVPFDHGIGVIAKTLDQALKAKKMLQIDWDSPAAVGFNSQEIYSEYEKIAQRPEKGSILVDKGDTEDAFRKASRVYSADFKNDYVYHAQMEPLNAVIRITENGEHAEAWVGSQQGFDSKLGIPGVLGIPAENVKINLMYLGGGFGRRSMTDFVTECAVLAKAVAPSPVKLIWTREDDLSYGAFRPLTLQRLKAAVDAKGRLTALSHMVIGDGGNLVASGIRNEFYDIANQTAEWRDVSHGIRLKHWRSVGHGPNKFAIESMIDEVAAAQGIDPMDFRRQLMSGSPRALATLEAAETMSDWKGSESPDRAKGVAFLERSGTLSTGICELSVNRKTGRIRVHRFWSAIDAGLVVQPDNVKAQMEGGILMGISSVLKEQITIENGKVVQSNYHNYELLRIDEIPESIETKLLPSSAPPEGVGESGTPLVACAIANAFFRLTGKRLRHLPFTPERVLQVLNI